MGDLTKNLSRSEVACNCGCGFDTIDYKLVQYIQDTCAHFAREANIHKVVLTITGPNRCAYWNGHEKGARDSEHLEGKALDFRIEGLAIHRLYEHLDTMYGDTISLGIYDGRVHLGVRDGGKRWDLRGK